MNHVATLIACLLIAAVAPTHAAPAPDVAPATAPLTIAPLVYSTRILDNGLRVYAIPDSGTANVSVQVWYDVGSRDDPRGRSGFAHLFEHLLFKATRNMVSEQFDRLTEDVGGYNNASTADDYTNYFEVVPANHLQRLLWAEAERMGSLVVDAAVFKSERDVVKEELRQRILAAPYGKLFGLYVTQSAYDVHPYGRPGIGSIAELDAATVEDVRAFHATYYRPDNAVLVVAGNFDPAQLDAWVDRYFAPIARPERPIPRVSAVEPVRTAPRTLTVYEPNTPLPAAVVTFQGPAAADPDMPAMLVLDAILAKGESSRLYQSLVYEQRLAAQAFTFFSPSKDPGTISIAAIMAEGKTAADGVAALRAEAARLREGPVSAAELDEAQTQLVSDALRGRETAEGKAYDVANAAIVYGTPERANTLLGDIQRVTVADVQRVARKYLVDDHRVAIRYLDTAAQATGEPATPIATAATVQAATLRIPASEITIVTPAPDDQRIAPPAPAAPVAITTPAATERTLGNGLRVIVAPDHDLPLVSAGLRVMAGSAADPVDRAGTASLVADLVSKGAGARSATQIAQSIEALGGELATAAGWDSSVVSLAVRSDRLTPAFAVLADVVRAPTFAAEEVERQRQQTLDGLSVALRQPGTLASLAANRMVFGAEPYGRAAGGTPMSVARIDAAALAAFHATWWRPDNAVLVLSGDISVDDGVALAQQWFGDWAKSSMPLPAAIDRDGATAATPAPAPAREVLVIDLPASGQAAVTVARRGIARTDPDYFPAQVANSILGGGYSSRLNQEIRIKRGLSYGAGSTVGARVATGPVTASTQTKNVSAPEVVALMLAELERLGSGVPGAAELTARKAVLIGSFGRAIETTAGLAGALSELASYELPLAELDRYVANVQAVTAAQVQAVGGRVFDPAAADIVVVGDSQKFLPALRAAYPQVEMLAADALQLDSPTLK